MNIDNSYRGKCFFCENDVGHAVVFKSSSDSQFKYLPKGECAHIECYIDYCLDKSLQKRGVSFGRGIVENPTLNFHLPSNE